MRKRRRSYNRVLPEPKKEGEFCSFRKHLFGFNIELTSLFFVSKQLTFHAMYIHLTPTRAFLAQSYCRLSLNRPFLFSYFRLLCLPSPVYPAGFFFCNFAGFLAIFNVVISNNNNNILRDVLHPYTKMDPVFRH